MVKAIGYVDSVRAAVPPGMFSVPGVVRRGDPLVIRGWALQSPGRLPFDAVEALFADGTAADGVFGLPRPDVVAAFSLEESIEAGFTIVGATDDLTPGPHEVVVRGRRDGDEPQTIGRFVVEVRAPTRAPDASAGTLSSHVVIDGARLDPSVSVIDIHGWALDARTSLPGTAVVVTIGRLALEAVYGYPRPDIVKAFGLDDRARDCGFRVRVPTDELDGVVARAHLETAEGIRYSSEPEPLPEVSDAIAFTSAAHARGSIETVFVIDPESQAREVVRTVRARSGDRIVLTGWAASNAGDGEIVAIVDGMQRVPVVERIHRPDVASSFPGTAKPGFVASILLERAVEGFHEIEIHVRGTDGTLHPTAARMVVEVF